MLITDKTSYLERLENYVSQENITLSDSEVDKDSLLTIKDRYEKNEFDEKRLSKNIVPEAEKVFGAKARQMTDEEVKIHQQAGNKALVYKIVDGKSKILVYKRET